MNRCFWCRRFVWPWQLKEWIVGGPHSDYEPWHTACVSLAVQNGSLRQRR